MGGGLKHKGFIDYDAVAHRMVSFNEDSLETTITMQGSVGNNGVTAAICYRYSIIPTNPGSSCNCAKVTSCELVDPWYIYMGGASNSSGCSGGSLYTNAMVGYNGHNYAVRPSNMCVSGQNVAWTQEGSLKITYDTFTPGRPSAFNTTALEPHLPECMLSCTH